MKDKSKKIDPKVTFENAKEHGNIFTFETDKWFNKEYVIEQAKKSDPVFNLKKILKIK